MKPLSPLRILAVIVAAIAILWAISFAWNARAATQSTGFRWERETGAQKLTPTTSTALTIPAGTTNAEFYIEGGDVLVRWNGTAPVDSATGAMKWPQGHFRKEENDAAKLSGLRLLCASCTVWVNYSRERRNTDPVP